MLAQVPLGLLAARREQRQQRERDTPEEAVEEAAQEDRLVEQLHVADPEEGEPDGERDANCATPGSFSQRRWIGLRASALIACT